MQVRLWDGMARRVRLELAGTYSKTLPQLRTIQQRTLPRPISSSIIRTSRPRSETYLQEVVMRLNFDSRASYPNRKYISIINLRQQSRLRIQ